MTQATIYFQFPLTLPGKWLESRIHGDVVTQMRLSLDDKRLITASRDGSLCFWKVRAKFVTNLKNLPIHACIVGSSIAPMRWLFLDQKSSMYLIKDRTLWL